MLLPCSMVPCSIFPSSVLRSPDCDSVSVFYRLAELARRLVRYNLEVESLCWVLNSLVGGGPSPPSRGPLPFGAPLAPGSWLLAHGSSVAGTLEGFASAAVKHAAFSYFFFLSSCVSPWGVGCRGFGRPPRGERARAGARSPASLPPWRTADRPAHRPPRPTRGLPAGGAEPRARPAPPGAVRCSLGEARRTGGCGVRVLAGGGREGSYS